MCGGTGGKPIHIIWDWNGTLLDDTAACVATLNEMLTLRGREPVTLAFFRENFMFPSRVFYTRIGMEVSDDEWDALAKEYYLTYLRQPQALNVETREVLSALRQAGVRQSMLSALRQDLLEQSLVRYGIRDFFTYVYGVDNLDGASKLSRAYDLRKALASEIEAGGRVVMIGDALHDKEVADEVGFDCVLCAQGSHSYSRLAAVAPTGRTLSETVSLFGIG